MSDVNPDVSPFERREGELVLSRAQTRARSLDVSDRVDRGTLREAARRRWPVDPEFRKEAVEALRAVLVVAREKGDINATIDVVRTLAVLESQTQIDDEREAKREAESEKDSGEIRIIYSLPRLREPD